ncbi:MAG: NAD(P)H-hydrate dehydratase [Planctomycetes bacterium]|nr:NAD(P)H-hydrate dehydratase [Planctomycetota bacterium]
MNNILPKLPSRDADSHKGTFGTTLIIGGCKGMSGAMVLCGTAALKSGAGLVQIGTPLSIRSEVAIGNPCYTTIDLPEDKNGQFNHQAIKKVSSFTSKASAIVLGPGAGATQACQEMAYHLLNLETPVLLDADALNSMASNRFPTEFKNKNIVITPHPGEFSRLTRLTAKEIQADRKILAMNFAQSHGLIVVLKGHGTVVSDGKSVYVNATGNPGMATGGSGDVLSGIIGALLGQGIQAFEAAKLGVYLHGLAGDHAKKQLGEHSLTALDILEHLPSAFLYHEKVLL